MSFHECRLWSPTKLVLDLGLEPSTSPIAIGALSRLSYSPTDDAVVLGALSRLSFSPKERTRAGALFQYSKRAGRPQLLKVAL